MEHDFLRGCVRLLAGKEELIGTLNAKLATTFERKLFEAAINNLLDAYNPLRFNNYAYATRELVRHILSRLAPDTEVRACDWYKNETQNEGGITRNQRVAYAIQGGLTNDYVALELQLDSTSIRKRIKDVVGDLSKHTHIQPETFDIDPATQDAYVSESLESMRQLFEVIKDSKKAVSDALADHIDQEVLKRVIGESIDEIDEISSHHIVEDVCVELVDVLSISSSEIHLSVEGKISAELQWGSNGDVRRGDGVVFNESFPFSCTLRSTVSDPGKFPDGPQNFRVYNDDWFGET